MRLSLLAVSVWATLALLPPGARADDPATATAAAPAASPAPAAAQEAHSLRALRASDEEVPITQRLISALGLVVMMLLAWSLSPNKRVIHWRVVAWGVGLQLLFGVFVLKTRVGLVLFSFLNDAFDRLLGFTKDGARFLFGEYLDLHFTFALNVLPTIIFFSALMALFYHVGFMQRVVHAMAWVMQRTMRTSGAETLSTAANVFLGQTEAPLLVKPFIATMTRSELMAIMVGGFATVAGGVLAAYVGMLQSRFPDIAGHLIAASVLGAPATLVCAKLAQPEVETPKTAGSGRIDLPKVDTNAVDALARGALEGLYLALNVGAMLLAFLAVVALVNYLLAIPVDLHNRPLLDEALRVMRAGGAAVDAACVNPSGEALRHCVDQAIAQGHLDPSKHAAWIPWTLERVLGWIFWPLAFVMGVPAQDCSAIASLLGEKMVLNEFVAYLHLSEMLNSGAELSHRAVVIATYAFCGFANFGSIAIQIGGIGGMAPERRGDIAALGLRAMLAGTLASFMTACVAGLLV